MRVAVADVGTNSTHLMIAEAMGGHYRVLDALKVRTRLGECLDERGHMTPEGEARLCDALTHFRELADAFEVPSIRVYATSALREAPNGPDIAERVSRQTGVYPVIISGDKEGRLTYLGAAQFVDFGTDNLLLDLGGGSIEFIRGGPEEVRDVISLPLGGIRMQDGFLRSDPPSKAEFRALIAHLEDSIKPYRARFGSRGGGTRAFLSSGTAQDVALALAHEAGQNPTSLNGLPVTTEAMGDLLDRLRRMTLAERAQIPAFEKRARIIVAAVAVLHTAMRVLNIREATISEGALREGMLAEELNSHQAYVSGLSARHRSALALAERYRADLPHARQVTALARDLFAHLLSEGVELPERGRGLLRAAATTHDIGEIVAQSSHHKHSAYLIRHSGLLGFTPHEVELVAQIARYHRRSLPRDTHVEYMALSAADRQLVSQMAAILRVADGLDRSSGGGSLIQLLERRGRGRSRRWVLRACVPNSLDRQGVQQKADLWTEVFGPLEFEWLEDGECEALAVQAAQAGLTLPLAEADAGSRSAAPGPVKPS